VLKELDSFLPAWWSRNNPVDTVAGESKLQLRVMDVLARYEQIDSIIALMLPTPETAIWTRPENEKQRQERDQIIIDHYEQVFPEIKRISKKYNKPVIVAADIMLPHSSRDLDTEIKNIVAANESVYYRVPDEAAMVLDALARYGEYLDRA
jgi:acyl-CoA synthetase (NDP forming)